MFILITAYFVSFSEHQKLHWNKHKSECKALAEATAAPPVPSAKTAKKGGKKLVEKPPARSSRRYYASYQQQLTVFVDCIYV
jgi:hypothetical protein